MNVRGWKHSINIKQFLVEDAAVSVVVAGVKRELDRLPESLRIESGFDYDDIILLMDEAAEQEDVEIFDEALDNLYDWADEHRVWLGVKS